MTIKSVLECERKNLEKLEKLQLPNQYKKIGVLILAFSLIILLINSPIFEIKEISLIAKYGMLLGLLIISITKEKIEDEFISKLRMQSYRFAFISGVGLTIILPLLDFIIDSIFKSKEVVFNEFGMFEILWILLSVQVFFFEYLKKLNK